MTDVPRPDHWGGYLLRPSTVEFWQGQVGRLHDRFALLARGPRVGESSASLLEARRRAYERG